MIATDDFSPLLLFVCAKTAKLLFWNMKVMMLELLKHIEVKYQFLADSLKKATMCLKVILD